MAKLLRFHPEFEAKIAALAARERRTFTAQVMLMLERQYEAEQERRDREEPRRDA